MKGPIAMPDFGVIQGWGMGEFGDMTVQSCSRCGAVIAEPEIHAVWHYEQEKHV